MHIKKIVVFLMFSVIFLPASPGVATMPFRYLSPTDLSIHVELVSKDRSGAILRVTVKSLVGTLRDLEIIFRSFNNNMSTQPSSAKLPALPQGQQKQYEVKMTKTALSKKSELGLRVTVDYYRDYTALRQKVATDPKYSDKSSAGHLNSQLKRNEASGIKTREGIKFNF